MRHTSLKSSRYSSNTVSLFQGNPTSCNSKVKLTILKESAIQKATKLSQNQHVVLSGDREGVTDFHGPHLRLAGSTIEGQTISRNTSHQYLSYQASSHHCSTSTERLSTQAQIRPPACLPSRPA
jgi:hypothetical protein